MKRIDHFAESLDAVRLRAARCKNCPLWEHATQTVFGEGPATARVVLVGEQPGDSEDRAGRPFVGPAGQLLDESLLEAGIDRSLVYVTNAVKHFKWEPRGKRRIHQKPNAMEIAACRPWLDLELAALQPQVLVCLGATAAQALLGRAFRVTKDRGKLIPSDLAPWVLATIHPSAVLRTLDEEREEVRRAFVNDLRQVAAAIEEASRTRPP